jgi:hypothetical protein
MRKTLFATSLVLVAALAAPAFASDDDRRGARVPAADWMSIADVTQKLGEKGLKVTKVETDDGVYEIYATGENGARIKAKVHPKTGEILSQRSR